MSEDQGGSSKPADPLKMFQGMRDAYLDSMAKAMVEAVNTEGYAEATGAMLNNSLAMTAPYREAVEKSMVQALQQLSLPSRQDIVALAERLTNLEMRLDDMDATLDRIEKQTRAVQPAGQAAQAKSASSKPIKPAATRAATPKKAAGKRVTSAKKTPSNKRALRKVTR